MSLISVIIGPWSNIYVGDYTDTNVLTEITDLTTGPSELYEGFEDQFFPGLGKQLQIGTFQSTVPFVFYDGNDINVHNLARGLSMANTNINTPPENTLYTLLLIGPNTDLQTSVLISPCRTKRDKKVSRAKTSASSVALLFTAENQSRYSGIITYGTPDELSTVLGIRSPL